jgi:ribonuclease J
METSRNKATAPLYRATRNSAPAPVAAGAPTTVPKTYGHSIDSRKRSRRTIHEHRPSSVPREVKNENVVIPSIGDAIRIIPLGGAEEIGKNMTVVQYKDDIIIIDAGIQFSTEDTPGIDYILPNTKYLEDNKEKIRAIVITHGHLDHIGGLPYIMERIGNPPLSLSKSALPNSPACQS